MVSGRSVVKLLAEALRSENAELTQLAKGNPSASLKSVWQFNEDWVRYVLVKHATKVGAPLIGWEREKVDLQAYDGERVVLEIELKGPWSVRGLPGKTTLLEKLLADFRKQAARAKASSGGCEHLVVVLVHGPGDAVLRWANETLGPAASAACPGVRLDRFSPISLPLGGSSQHGDVLVVLAFRVTGS